MASIGRWLPQDYLRGQNDRKNIVAAAEGERRYRLIKKPGADALVREGETMNQETIDVGPIDGTMSGMPDHPLLHSGRQLALQTTGFEIIECHHRNRNSNGLTGHYVKAEAMYRLIGAKPREVVEREHWAREASQTAS